MLKTKTPVFASNVFMGRLYLLGLFLFSILFVVPLSSSAQEFSVIKALNGDTIQVKGQDAPFFVRLAGIDAPELTSEKNGKAQPFSREAKTYLESLVLNKRVSIKGYGEKDFDLMWGVVFLGDRNVNLEMVRNGYAAVYLEKSFPGMDLTSYYSDEKAAKAARKGMWAQGKDYVAPAKFREKRKTKRSIAAILYGILHQGRKGE